MATPEKYKHINFKPPQGARDEAEKSLAWRREFGRGGTAVGIARARDLANGVELSPSTVRRMKAFFDRHQKNKSAPGWSPDEDGFPSNSRIAWAMWGSDAGWSWAKKVVEQMNAADEKEERGLRPYGSTHGMRPKVYVVHGAPCSGKKDYVASHMGENDVVFDYDKVMAAISGRPIYQPTKSLVSYCLDIRTLILKKAMRGQDVDKTWIITTRVGDEMKSQLSDIPVEYVHIDTPKDECLQRLESDPERQPLAEELRTVIDEYFSGGDREEQRRAPTAQPGVERRFIGNFSSAERLDPELLRIEKRADPETGRPRTYLIGYAARFHRDSLLLGDFVERIDPGAFDIVLNREDEDGKPLETRCLFNHDPNHLLGRFPTTMRMVVDDKGLRYECLLPESRKDIEELCLRSDLRGSSFSFVVAEGGERWSTENGQSIRLVTKIKSLLDCGPVTYPAYGDASVEVVKRSYEQFCNSRGFCPTGEGGGVDNSCGTDESASGGRKASSALTGALAGAAAGALAGGIPGAVIGAAALGFAAYVASGKKTDEALEKAKSDIGVDDNKLNKATAFVFGKGKPQDIDTKVTQDGVIAMRGREGQVFISGKPPAFGMKGKSNLHFNPNGGGGNVASAAEGAAEAAGVQTVSVQSWSPEHDSALKSAGFKKTGGAFSKAEGHDVWIKDLSKSKRSVQHRRIEVLSRRAEILRQRIAAEAFLAERRDCGRGEDGRFGSGNKCQEDEGEGQEESASPPANRPSGDIGKKEAIDYRPMTSGAGKTTGGIGKKKALDYTTLTSKHKTLGDAPKKKSDDAYVAKPESEGDWLGRKPRDGDVVPKSKVPDKYGKQSSKKKDTGAYMEWKKGKDAEAQDFIDTARKGQLERGGKDGGKADDGSGVQTWSKGDSYPWTTKQVGDSEKGGYVQGIHPDGSKTEKYKFPAGSDASEAYKQAEAEIKKKNKRSLKTSAAELRAFLEARR